GIANMANAPCDVVGLRERDGLSGVAGIEGIANMANAPCDVVGLRERDGLSGVAGIEVKIDRDDKQCN
ncbi:hypothetical protein Tco_1000387, partial [Tanacetum coccineum]